MAVKVKIKSSKKYLTRFKKMAFGGEPEGEYLSLHAMYDENGNVIEELKIDDETGSTEQNLYIYDAQNRLLSHELIIESDGISEKFEFNRDEKGRLISEVKYYSGDEGEKSIYTYAAHDQPISIERFDSDGEPESFEDMTYNEKDLLTNHIKYGPDKKVVEKSTIIYNEKERPVERKTFDGNDKLLRETFLQYNDKGELFRIIERNADGKVTSDITTIFDDRGNVIERKIRDFHSRTLRFTFDDDNNCIEESMYDENGNLTMKTSYEFDDNNLVVTESGYFMDMNRSQQLANTHSRFEYELYG